MLNIDGLQLFFIFLFIFCPRLKRIDRAGEGSVEERMMRKGYREVDKQRRRRELGDRQRERDSVKAESMRRLGGKKCETE